MQENIITIGLGSPALRVLGQEELPGLSVVTVVYRQGERVCPCCGHVTAKVHEYHPQRKQGCPLGTRRVLLRLLKRRFRCIHCGKVLSLQDPEGKEEVSQGWYREAAQRLLEAQGASARTPQVDGGLG